MVIIELQSLINELKDSDEIRKIQGLIAQLPLVFMGETLFKGCLCISASLTNKLLQIIKETKNNIQRIDVQIKQDLLIIKLIVKRKNNLYSCLLKIKNIEININNKTLVLHLSELPQFRTNNVFENLLLGFGSMVTNVNSGEEFIIKYLVGNTKGILINDKNITIDIQKVPYLCEIYHKEIFGLKFIDVVEIRDVLIKEGVVEILWNVAMPSIKELNLE